VAKARQLHKLFARQIAALSKPGRYSDGGGLYVVVAAGGTKRWVFLFMRDGRQREMGLGSILSIGLAAARERAAECRALLAAGKVPSMSGGLRARLGRAIEPSANVPTC